MVVTANKSLIENTQKKSVLAINTTQSTKLNCQLKGAENPMNMARLSYAWMDRSKDKVGYEINSIRYYYQIKPLRSVEEITKDLLKLDKESVKLLGKIMRGCLVRGQNQVIQQTN